MSGIDGVKNSQGTSRVGAKPVIDSKQKPSKVVIPLSEQKWVPQSINPSDYKSVSGLRKRFPVGLYDFTVLPKDLIESNGAAGLATVNGKTVELDELTMFDSTYGPHHYGSVGIKHTSKGDEIYVNEVKDGFSITSKYDVNGKLVNVEKIPIGSPTCSGIMPWC